MNFQLSLVTEFSPVGAVTSGLPDDKRHRLRFSPPQPKWSVFLTEHSAGYIKPLFDVMADCEDDLINGFDRLRGRGDNGDSLRTLAILKLVAMENRDPSREGYLLVSSN